MSGGWPGNLKLVHEYSTLNVRTSVSLDATSRMGNGDRPSSHLTCGVADAANRVSRENCPGESPEQGTVNVTPIQETGRLHDLVTI